MIKTFFENVLLTGQNDFFLIFWVFLLILEILTIISINSS